jgi:hypothetical protein
MAHSHSHDGGIGHSHDDPFNGHGHSHEILDGPGSYANREMPLIEGRDWKDRAFTVGIGGYVPSVMRKGEFQVFETLMGFGAPRLEVNSSALT